jgi:hypothetical protein
MAKASIITDILRAIPAMTILLIGLEKVNPFLLSLISRFDMNKAVFNYPDLLSKLVINK